MFRGVGSGKGNISPLRFGILVFIWAQCLCTGETILNKGRDSKRWIKDELKN